MQTELFLKGRLRKELSADEKQALDASVARTIELEPRQTLVERGERLDCSYYLIEGSVLRHLDDDKGERQLLSINIAGDFVDLHAFPMKRLDHSVVTLTRCQFACFNHTDIAKLVAEQPHLARALWFSTLLDAAMHREWIFRLGRLNAEGRIAHLVCELIERLRLIERYDGETLNIPLLQRDYAEACGITTVHANRSFRILRERGFLEPQGDGVIRIVEEEQLRQLAQFSGDYLYGEGELAVDSLEDR